MTSWSGATVLTTPRLTLRGWREDDLPSFAAMNTDPEVMRHLGGKPLTRERSDEIAEAAERSYAAKSFGLLAVERTHDGAFLGFCGLHRLHWMRDEVEIGWRLGHPYWGHGYATEAATAWLDHGFDVLGLPQVISVTDSPNVRSLAVMRKLGIGLDHEEDVVLDDGDSFTAMVHTITAEQWRLRRRR